MRRLGQIAIVGWFCVGFVLLIASALTGIGPCGWTAALENAAWGSDNVVISVIPWLAILMAPMFLLDRMERRPNAAFQNGLKDGMNVLVPTRDAEKTRAAMSETQRLQLRALGYRRSIKGALIFAGLSVITGFAIYAGVVHVGSRNQGDPIPSLTLQQAVTAGTLPDYARIAGVTGQTDAVWVRDYNIRQSGYRDFYLPLTGPDWKPGDPVALLEEDRTMPKYDESWDNMLDPPGPREGALTRDPDPAWIVGAMRNAGLAVVDHPVVLTRKKLDGRVPGPDMIGAWLAVYMGCMMALFALIIAFVWSRMLRNMPVPVPMAGGRR